MESSTSLSPLQVAEIRKAFALCDTDGNGEIDGNELQNVMAHITGEAPSEEDVQRMLLAVDKDQSGTVSLDEFLEAVGEWLSESATSAKRFKVMSAAEEKKELHHQIKGFFSQFKKADNYEAVRQKISDAQEGVSPMETGMGWFGFRAEGQTSEQKLNFLQEYHTLVADLDNIIAALLTDGITRVNALSSLEKLLSIIEVFSRPSDRSAIADDLAQLFEALVRCNLPDILYNILQTSGEVISQATALKCLALFVQGPRVPSTPTTSLMHPKQAYFKKMAIASDVPLVASRFLNFSSQLCCEQALHFVASMVSDDADIRDYFLENHIISLICPLILDTSPDSILLPSSTVLAALCGVTHTGSLPTWDYIQPAFTPLGHLLFSENDQILTNVLQSFSLILPGVRPDYSIIARILELINTSPAPAVVQHALRVVMRVAKFDPIQTTAFLARGLLDSVKLMLTSDHASVRSGSLDVLDVLSYVRQQFQPILNAGFLEIIANLIPMDESLRIKLVSIILSLSQSGAIATAMAAQGFIPLLCGALSWFKEFDDVIFEAYAVEGPTFNYELISDIVSALENIVMVGETERMEQSAALNLFFLRFDLECVKRIEEVLQALSEVTAAGMESWRREKDSASKGALDARLVSILTRLSAALEQATSFQINNLVKEPLMRYIASLVEQYQVAVDPSMEVQTTPTVLIKCYYPDDIRVFEAAKSISYEELVELITAKYGREMIVSYLDAEGDAIRLEPNSMNVAFATADSSSMIAATPTVKLQLADSPPTSMQSSVTTPPAEDGSSQVSSKKRGRAGEPLLVASRSAPTAFSGGNTFLGAKGLNLALDADAMKDEFAAMRLVQKNQSFRDIRKGTKFDVEALEAALEYLASGHALDRDMFTKVMNGLGITDPLVIAQNFNAHDVDRDGTIDFREFAVTLATVVQGTSEEKLRLMFRTYDTDNSGNLSVFEVLEIFRVAMHLNGTLIPDAQLMSTVSAVFQEIDTDGNGEISFDEFKAAVESGKLPISFSITSPRSTRRFN